MSTLIFYLQKRKFFFIPGVISILKGNKTITEQLKKYTDHIESQNLLKLRKLFLGWFSQHYQAFIRNTKEKKKDRRPLFNSCE